MIADPAMSRLREWVIEEGEPLASSLQEPSEAPSLGALVAEGDRTAADAGEYTLVLEAIREGYLCHYGEARILADADADLLLLAGDLFYAYGIRRLAGLEDLESVGILSDLIRIAADLHARGEAASAERLWLIQILALSCGSGPAHDELLKGLEEGRPGALEALEEWSRQTSVDRGVGRALNETREAIDFRSFRL